MKKRTKLFLSVVLVITIVFSGVFLFKNNSKQSISTILSNQSYAYLPAEAKEYIKKVYEETGEVILTEKNKEDNEPYLNPDYVEYLKTGESSEYGHIPEKYIVDHSYKNDALAKQGDANEKLSLSYYNLRDDGYITNIYDQGSEGLCWAFSSVTSLESYFAIKSNKTKMLTFSEKQIDYATTKATKAIDIESNPYINNDLIIGEDLNDGGNMLRFANSTAIGISPVLCDGNCSNGTNYNNNNSITSNKYWKYDYNYSSKLSPYEITNIDNTEYSLNEFLFFDPLSTNNQADVDALVNLIKQQIVNNGSLYVGVGAYTNLSIEYTPSGSESALNADGKNVIYYIPYGWNPSGGINHAVSVIGWDDNYSHNVCLDKSGFEITDAKKVGNDYSCTKGDLYTINGAWIVQNSWGNENTFIYLPYNTMKSSYSSVSDVSEVDYDNSYRATKQSNTFTKGNTKESVKKVKFYVNAYNKTISVLYRESTNEIIVKDNSYSSNAGGVLLKSQKYSQPGLYTIDISEDNIIFDEETSQFKLTFYGDYVKYDYYGSIHTNNVNEDKFIDLTKIKKTDEKILTKCTLEDNKCISESHSISFDDNNVFIISGISRNLSSNDNLTFKVLDQNQENVTNLFHVFRNYSVSNYINAFISYNNEDVALGTYTIEVYYNNNKYDELEWSLTKHNNVMAGIGTEDNPYEIKTASDLNDLRNQNTKGNYYVLNNDLDLSYDTTNTKGLFYNSGAGWLPIDDFYGSFDGNNHVISGLYINRPKSVSDDPVGIFEIIYGTNCYIKNLIIKDVNINGNYDAGALAGKVSVTDGIEINNISVIGGKVISSYYTGGLIGGITSTNGVTENINCNMYNLYSNVIVGNTDTSFAGGIVGVIESSNKVLSTTINDSVSFSKVSGNGSLGNSAIGGIAGLAGYQNSLTITNAISAGSYNTQASTRLGDAIGYVYDNNSLTMTGIWHTSINKLNGSLSSNDTQIINNNTTVTFDDVITHKYTNYFEHKSQWSQPEIDGIKRLPMLTTLLDKFDFTETIDDFELKVSGSKNIYELISPSTDSAKRIEWTYDDEYLTISSSGVITPKKEGVTTIHITSLYDGYKDDIQVTITQMSTITFNSNNANEETNSQEVAINQDFNLAKNTFTYKGHTFKRWNTKANGTGTNYSDEQLIEGGINEDLTLYAIWDEIQYKITFNGNGATSSSNNTVDWDLTYPTNGTVTFGDMGFSRDNYILDNWNTDQNGTGTKYSADLNDSITFDDIPFDGQYKITLYAQWKEETYTITFKANQGTGEMADLELVKNVSANLPKNTFTRNGYTFKEWNTKANGTGTKYSDEESISITKNTTLYAIWNPITYQIKYDSNGGTGNMNNSNLTYDKPFTLSDNLFTKANKKFKEWNTDPNGTGTSYANKASVTNLTNENNQIITLYAIWEDYGIITNNTSDFEVIYDGNNHGITINVDVEDYTIRYSVGNTNYDLDSNPTFKDIGEYIVNYKISKSGYEDLIGSNKVKIYGIIQFDSSIKVNDGKLVIQDNSFDSISDKITTYSTSTEYKHYNKNNELVTTDTLKTGDIIKVIINGTKTYEYRIAFLGDTSGDGKINYLDYVNVYNHIQKVKHPELNKNLLVDEYLLAADMSGDNKISYLDYVRIYNKIKELKGGTN